MHMMYNKNVAFFEREISIVLGYKRSYFLLQGQAGIILGEIGHFNPSCSNHVHIQFTMILAIQLQNQIRDMFSIEVIFEGLNIHQFYLILSDRLAEKGIARQKITHLGLGRSSFLW